VYIFFAFIDSVRKLYIQEILRRKKMKEQITHTHTLKKEGKMVAAAVGS
jgi:hypothetical protein